MPGHLQDVVQSFGIDATAYNAGKNLILGYNREIITSVKEVNQHLAGIGEALKALPDRRIKIDVDTSGAMAKIGRDFGIDRVLDAVADSAGAVEP